MSRVSLNQDAAERFLCALDSEERFTFQSFDDDRERKDTGLARILHGTLDQHWTSLERLNEKGAGIFVTINQTDLKGRLAKNIIRVRACFVDLDSEPLPETFYVEPHIITETSPDRWHVYWLVHEVALEDFSTIQKRLAVSYRGDPVISDLPRVMRLPGFVHRKRAPFVSRLVEVNGFPPYKLNDLLVGLPELKKKTTKLKTTTAEDTFWNRVNAAALANPSKWVTSIFPTARYYDSTGCYRITSKDLGRALEEDLIIGADGILDAGRERGLTPIDVVLEFGSERTPRGAALWLCDRVGTDPRQLGYVRGNGQDRGLPFGGFCSAPLSAPEKIEGSLNWPHPHPLPDNLLPVAPFDLDLIPSEIRPWVSDVCERMQCPPDYIAVSLMAALGSMIGRKVAIRPQMQDDWEVFANQWALLIGQPGVLKSPAMEESLRPLRGLSAMAEEKLKKEMASYEVRAAAAKLRHDENVKQAGKLLRKDRKADVSALLEAEDEVPPPTLKRYIANDTNVASLGVLLQQNPNGLLVFRDEIVSLLDNLDREECISERGFYLTGWSGNSRYTFDRIGRGLHLTIDGVCLSMLGSTQPGRISQYLSRAIRGGRGDDGLIQRFGLMVWPDVSADWKCIDRWPNRDAKAAAIKLFEQLDGLDWRAIDARRDRGPDGDEEGMPYLRFGYDAYDVFLEWRTALERRLRSGELHPALEAHLAKYRKLVPGLALISHLADGLSGSVRVAAVRQALAWATYLETHAQRAYSSVTAASAETAKAIIAKVRSGQLKAEFRSHEVWRPRWSRLTDREAVQAGLTMLVDFDWLAVRRVQTAGRPALIYSVNPKAMGT